MVVGAAPDPCGMIPIFRPCIGEEEIAAVTEVLRSGWLGLGPRTRQFETAFAAYTGTDYAVAVNSCTAALHLSLRVLGIDGGEVVTTPITFTSTAHAILYCNAQPVFADVQEDTLTIDPDAIEKQCTEKTRAIIPVHYGGHVCDMKEIQAIAQARGIPVIEDAAHACGATYAGKKAGSLGRFGCFSFNAVKNLTTGEGGMITTNERDAVEILRKLRWLGINRSTFQRLQDGYSWHYDVEHIGFKEHMHDIAAALGIVQLKNLDRMNECRRQLAARYTRAFQGTGWIRTPVEKTGVRSSCHNYVIRVDRDRNALIAHLKSRGIAAGVHYMPLYLHSAFRKRGIRGTCPVADRVWQTLVTLPLYPTLSEEEQDRVIRAVSEFGG